MPGRYEHTISLNFNQGTVDKVSIIEPFNSLGSEINSEINDIQNKVRNIASNSILSKCALESQQLQRQALAMYGSNKSGRLSNSINISMGSNVCSIGTDLFYAQYVNDGRGPVHVQNAQALHFISNGKEIFVKSVGSANPRPYLETSNSMLGNRIDEIINSELGSVL